MLLTTDQTIFQETLLWFKHTVLKTEGCVDVLDVAWLSSGCPSNVLVQLLSYTVCIRQMNTT